MSDSTGVYQIRNTVNGRVYVGSAAKSFKRRWAGHRRSLKLGTHCNRHLQAAWVKYSAECFVFEVLEECPPEMCIAREQWHMDDLRAYDVRYGYNLSPTAGSQLGYKHTPEGRANMSAKAKQYFSNNPAARDRLSKQSKAYFTDPEKLQQHREKIKAYVNRPEVKARMRDQGVKRFESQEYRDRHGATLRKVAQEPMYRKRQSEIMRAVWKDPEYRQRCVRTHAERCNRPEEKAKFAERMVRFFSGPGERDAMSSRSKKLWEDPEYVEKTKRRQAEYRAANPDRLKKPPSPLGRKVSDETKEKISRANRGRKMSDEQRQYLSKIRTGAKDTPEQVEVKRARAVAMWADPAKREELISKIKKSSNSKKRSESQRRRRASEKAAREAASVGSI